MARNSTDVSPAGHTLTTRTMLCPRSATVPNAQCKVFKLTLVPSQWHTRGTIRASLVTQVVNVKEGGRIDLSFSPLGWTGEAGNDASTLNNYAALRLTCNSCHRWVGWKILKAFNEAMVNSEGKYMIYTEMMTSVV